MLKYQINANRQRNDLVPIDISDFTIEDIIDSMDDSENFTYSDKQLLMCYCDNEFPFDENARIIVKSERYMDNDDLISATAYSFNTVYKPTSVNKENRSFTLTIDKYFDLSIEKTDIVTDENDKEWWYLYFNGSHLFDTQSNDIYTLYLTFDGINGYNVDKPNTFLIGTSVDYITDTDSDGKGEYINSSTIRIEKEALDKISGLSDVIFYGTVYRLKSNPSSVVSEEYYNSLRPEQQAEYYKDYEYKDVSRLKLYRDNFIFVPDGFTLYLDKPMAVLQIPFSQKFATDLMQDDAIRENFTEVERKKAINHITEMEKDVYHPVIWDSVNDKLYGEVYKIKFNLHFREHRGDDWLASADSYWNGIKGKGGSLEFIKNYFSYVEKDKDPSSFTDNDKKRISGQSDLLTYLNFTDKDVRYQKNKLKKSFLRVMFYDSTNPTNQNMLAYYTIFVDSGEDFSKYVRYIESEGYKRITKEPNSSGVYEVKSDLTGIKVDREPTKTSKLVNITDSTDVDDIEAVRISSQFVVEDKYMSDASSEGFYLYLWKDNMNGVMPTDIYMKVEFNHAGYGRTIPFMCPFLDPNKGEGNGFKTFDKIRQDWDVKEENYGTSSDTRYGIRKYLKYSYIHFKYKYDKVDKRHIYYLDDEFYGNGVYFKDNAITLNLYEAKIA